jgi:hypothetical protein
MRYLSRAQVGILLCLVCVSHGRADQVPIARIEQMPNMPSPYEMRGWRQVACGYDSLVFDFGQVGQYLPLIWWQTNTVNYPEHDSFGLHTVVGTTYPSSAEAINVLAAVVGASLAGIDKSNQNGHNWALMCEEWFNNRPEENVYLNHPVASSGSDWWYDTMPNVFFYQLYDLYPATGDFDYQFRTVADRWLEAVVAMGGSATPWQEAYMDYRGWYLASMTPNEGGVHEPEAAGAIGWLLYNAYVETGDPAYRRGAEWAMEFLDGRTTNPSYELQLPYGAHIAARMNAELGTDYDVERMVNWCFDVGPLRDWGAIVGNWGGYDCHGLIGEALGNGQYAFTMNSFEQVGALVPLVRYDDRFARAIGKWVLNVANAARLFYPNYLPDENQDSEEWSHEYDPNSYIAHEAMRATWEGFSPYATGDAISGGWGETNLALYGSSHVGILGGIIDTTNVEMILQLDVLRTDRFRDDAYPTFLYFNPHAVEKAVEIDVGGGQHDLYDAAANCFLQTGVSGTAEFTIPPDVAVLVVVAPGSGTVTYELEKMLINGIIVDYSSGQPVENHPPRIKALAAYPETVAVGKPAVVYCTAVDLDEDDLTYTWSADGGTLEGAGHIVTWTAPDSTSDFTITCQVSDGQGGQAIDSVRIEVVEYINHPPVITGLTARPRKIDLEATSELTCAAQDPDCDPLTYAWSADAGSFSGSGQAVTWTAPELEGDYEIACQVDDGHGAQAADTLGIRVRDFTVIQTGDMVAFYPFNGNANDESGHGLHGTVYGATLVPDRFGNANSAYYFDGIDDYVRVSNHPVLNFRESITINFWLSIGGFFDREACTLSHGNWENRWSISIVNERLRWNLRTDNNVNSGIKSLDSESSLELDTYYNVTVYYDGSDFEIYLNGQLDSFSSWSGLILTTAIDLLVGQALPSDSTFNFKGVIDDVRIFDYALSVPEIEALYDEGAPADSMVGTSGSREYGLGPNHPNPLRYTTTIRFELPESGRVSLRIFNAVGHVVRQLIACEDRKAGDHAVIWDGRDEQDNDVGNGLYLCRLETDDFTETRRMVVLR